MTLNPLAHLDPFGTLCFLFAGFGWAKPVPVNPFNFRYPSRDDILVSVAGVAANLLSALVFALIFRFVVAAYGADRLVGEFLAGRSTPATTIVTVLEICVRFNLVLIFFNMIPIPPLDGSHVLANLLPPDLLDGYNRIFGRYGLFILLGLVFIAPMVLRINILGIIIGTPTELIADALLG